MRVWLIQPAIAPYRVPLFSAIARAPGIDLTVVVQARRLAGHPWEIDPATVPFRVLELPSLRWRQDFERDVFISPSAIIRFLRDRPDVVICSGFTASTLLLYLPLLATRTPYLMWNEGTPMTEQAASLLKRSVRRLVARYARGFLVAGTQARAYVEGLLSPPARVRIDVAYNCVDNDRFTRAGFTDAEHARMQELKSRAAPRNLLHVGKLGERKGIVQLMEAYRLLVQRTDMQDVGLTLLGEGPLRGYVQEYATRHGLPHVYLEGVIGQDLIKAYYATADVFVLLSLADPNPLVLFEALGAGLPIVCSDRAGNAVDFIRDGVNGYRVDPEDIETVADRLAMALTALDRPTATRASRELVAKANYDDVAQVFLNAARAARVAPSEP